MSTFIGAGQPYVGDQLLHVIHLSPEVARPWNRSKWGDIKRVVGGLPEVLSCIPRQDRCGEITITVSNKLSKKKHQATLDAMVEALKSLGLHTGRVTQPQLRI